MAEHTEPTQFPRREPTFWLDDDGRHVWWEHSCLDKPRRAERLPLNPTIGWQTVSTDPLTVTPSILCRRCDTHGFITDGRWVEA